MSGGKSGKASQTTTYTADIILGLGEGVISNVPTVYMNQTVTTLSALGFGLIDGTLGQAVWAFLQSSDPNEALGYSGIGLLTAEALQLGASGQLPTLAFEVISNFAGTACNDADPSKVVIDILSNPQYGVGFDPSQVGTVEQAGEPWTVPTTPFQITVNQSGTFLDNLSVSIGGVALHCVASAPGPGQYSFTAAGLYTFNSAQAGGAATINYSFRTGLDAFQAFTLASGLWISPSYTEQTSANQVLGELANFTYSEFVWSQGVLGLIPRGTVAVDGSFSSDTCTVGQVVQLTEQWSNVYKSSAINLTNGQLTATLTADGIANVQATVLLNQPVLYYFESTVNFITSRQAVGFVVGHRSFTSFNTWLTAPFFITGHFGYDSNGLVMTSTFSDAHYGGPPVVLPTYGVGDVIGCAIKLFVTAGLVSGAHVWFRKNGGLWNNDAAADPATDTLGFDAWAANHPDALGYYPAWCGDNVGDAATANFGPVFAYIPPAGAISLNGSYQYTPPSAQFNLGTDDFLPNVGGSVSAASNSNDPVIITRLRTSDQENDIQIEFLDRNNQYAAGMAEKTDKALIDNYGRRFTGAKAAHFFCDPQAANISAQLLLQKEYVRKLYSFTVDERFILLDPMDLVTLTEPDLYLTNELVRVREITEQDDGSIAVVAEEVPHASGSAATVLPLFHPGGAGFLPDTGADPGSVNAPIIAVLPVQISGGAIQAGLALSGSNPNWGGCQVWFSEDGGASYSEFGSQVGAAAMGVTTSTLASGSDPDTTHSFGVDLTESHGTIASAVQADADAGRSLALVGSEIIAYSVATLTATNHYTLGTYLRRGQYGTSIGAQASGSVFTLVDSRIFRATFSQADIGKTIFCKFPSFNIWGSGLQSLASCTPYSFTLTGAPDFTPAVPSGLTATGGANQITLTWTANPATNSSNAVTGYKIFVAPGLSQPFGSAVQVATSAGSPFVYGGLAAGAKFTFFLEAVNSFATSGPTSGVNGTTSSAPGQLLSNWAPTVSLFDRRPDAGEIIMEIPITFACTLPAALTGSSGGVGEVNGTAATGSAVFTLLKNGASIGTATLPAAATGRGVATFSFASAVSFAAGDSFAVQAPAVQDATLAGFFFTFAGARN
jgi:hypothetical protein